MLTAPEDGNGRDPRYHGDSRRQEAAINTDDMLAIQQVIVLYSLTFDAGDDAGWANVFTADGVWESFPAGATAPALKLAGHEQLRAFCQRQFRNRPAGLISQHHQTGVYFDEVTADTARTRVMVIITSQEPRKPGTIYLTGVYCDRWKKTPAGWRLEYRALKS